MICKDCIHYSVCGYVEDEDGVVECSHFGNKADFKKVAKERDRAVDFIKYLDRNYSSYMTEDKRFKEWR